MRLKLNENQRSVLLAAQLNARTPVELLAKRAGLKPHTIRYHLQKLRQDRLIRLVPLVNPYSLGFEKYQVLFSVAPHYSGLIEDLWQELSTSWRIPWLAELSAEYQYGMTVCAYDLDDVLHFLDDLAVRFGNIFHKKCITPLVSFTYFRKRYLASRPDEIDIKFLSLHRYTQQFQADELDFQILAALFRDGNISHRNIAKDIGAPRATVDSRVLRMEEAKVIQGYVYAISGAELGLLSYKLLVYVRGHKKGFKERLFAMCAENPHCVSFIHCLGSWDFEIGVEVLEPSQVKSFMHELKAQFSQHLNEVVLLPVFRQGVSKRFLENPVRLAPSVFTVNA